MVISSQIAQSIVEETVKVIHRNINFMDSNASIIASVDQDRIGDFHEGALKVLKTQETVIIHEDDEFKGAKKGVNLPVYLNNRILGVIGITGEPDEVVQFGEVIRRMTEILLKEAHLEEQLELENIAKVSFIDEWIDGDWEDDKLFAARGWILGINVHLPRVAVVMDIIGFNDVLYEKLRSHQADVKGELEFQRFRREILEMVQNHFPKESQHVIIPAGSTRYTLLLSVDETLTEQNRKEKIQYRLDKIQTAIQSVYGYQTAIGVGKMYLEPRDAAKSVHEAERALLHAKNRKQSSYFYDQLGIESFAYDLPYEVREEYVKNVLQVESKQNLDQIIETLKTFYEANGSITEAAEKLFIHKNTLQYRLKRIKEDTGYDPRILPDATMFYVALTFHLINNGTKRTTP
jgi:carbohydrate diacid regulator